LVGTLKHSCSVGPEMVHQPRPVAGAMLSVIADEGAGVAI